MTGRHPNRTAAPFAAVAILVAALAAAEPVWAQDADKDQANVALGKQTYAENCSHCHGPNMMNPGTVTPDLRRFSGDKERFFDTVKKGKNNRMPPWGDIIDDDKIGALWAFVSSQRKP